MSLLLVGRPGLGKTLLLRDMARHLADEAGLAVVVVDTSLEIGGEMSVGSFATSVQCIQPWIGR